MALLVYILWLVVAIGIIALLFFLIPEILNGAHAQTIPPPKTTPTPPAPTPPAVTPPTVTNVPTPTSPTPNLQYLPQKAFVQSYAPEIGVPVPNVPLQSLPTVIAPPAQAPTQSSTGIGGFDIMGILAAVAAGGAYLKGHLVGIKANKTEEVSREQSQQIVKGAEVDQSIANQVYQNMADGGASIHDKPEIKLENLAKDREAAIKTATKS